MARTSPPISEQVVLAVADAENMQPTDLPALNDTVDIDALEALLDSRPPSAAPEADFLIRFTYSNSLVTIYDDRSIDVVPSQASLSPC